ncbi:DEAD/DEAH box helicase [Paenibacillus sp. J5C_2022]|uniref:DNA repair helicase XPB n=1 Tax=Paenibacillus sp. J5C2022 TaxID=2977129 RepID=UPI0021CEA3C8|nr:DNA repair helicase XPB [Paenibacillus sp. J5C2022]MCU6708972.1 DEAD/DEAH box helicase [Paenibacillus sp. J5C2022]
MKSGGALIVQSDLIVLLDQRYGEAEAARELLLRFADVVKKAGMLHTYRITAMSVWNAMTSGMRYEEMAEGLRTHARFGVPAAAEASIRLWAVRFGRLKLASRNGRLVLTGDQEIMGQLQSYTSLSEWILQRSDEGWHIDPASRGVLKQELTRLGYPVLDTAGYKRGEELAVQCRELTRGGVPFRLRDYQHEAVERFTATEGFGGGSGIVVLPCGTGKTIVGIAALAAMSAATLILTSSVTSASQWKVELLERTTLGDEEVGLYCGSHREVRPVTIATYNILTHRKAKADTYSHMKLFSDRNWGLIIYDEVQLLPAPVFRMTATIQATRRLGLTATLVREDGCAEDVYSLIGPKLYDMHWKAAEGKGHISTVHCTEIRLPLYTGRTVYHAASGHERLRIAAENPGKLDVAEQLAKQHEGEPTLVIGQYLSQLHEAADKLNAPLLTGEVPHTERADIYERFRNGEIKLLVVSKIANLAVDLPDATVAIQLSGSFGSRQEEAQRIGRLLRPKQSGNTARFYSLVTEETKETEFALKRQLFMLEQGYDYTQWRAAEGSGEQWTFQEVVKT